MRNLLFAILICPVVALAQNELLTDQNPNYMKSLEKYQKISAETNLTQSTTKQDTYYVYDRYEEKLKKKANKTEYKQERRLARINNRPSYNGGYYNRYHSYSRPWLGVGLGVAGASIVADLIDGNHRSFNRYRPYNYYSNRYNYNNWCW